MVKFNVVNLEWKGSSSIAIVAMAIVAIVAMATAMVFSGENSKRFNSSHVSLSCHARGVRARI